MTTITSDYFKSSCILTAHNSRFSGPLENLQTKTLCSTTSCFGRCHSLLPPVPAAASQCRRRRARVALSDAGRAAAASCGAHDWHRARDDCGAPARDGDDHATVLEIVSRHAQWLQCAPILSLQAALVEMITRLF